MSALVFPGLFCQGDTLGLALVDDGSLELCKGSKHSQQQSRPWVRHAWGKNQSLAQEFDFRTLAGDLVDQPTKIHQRAREAVNRCHFESVTVSQVRDAGFKSRARGSATRRKLVDELSVYQPDGLTLAGEILLTPLKPMSLNEAIGAKVNELLFLNRVTKKALGEELGITGPGVSRKIYGQTAWSVEDLYAVADFFGVDVVDLLPKKVDAMQETPDSLSRTEGSGLVAGAGFEPTTSGL